MASCAVYYDAIDQDNDPLPFTARFFLFHYVSGEWKYYSTYHMKPGVTASMSLTTGDKYRGEAVDYDGWKTPLDTTLTACQKDFTFKYEKEEAEGDLRNGYARPDTQTAGEPVEILVDVKNTGAVDGEFGLEYYEGSTHLYTTPSFSVRDGRTVTRGKIFTMPNRDFRVTVKLFRSWESRPDDTTTITAYLYVISYTDYYVKNDGNDSSAGDSWGNAWKTIDHAARNTPDGATLHIGFGYYSTEPAGNKIFPQNIGTKGIEYKPEAAGGPGGTGTVIIDKN